MSASSSSRTTDLDPDIQYFVETVKAQSAELSGGKPVTLAERRRIAERVRERWAAGGPSMRTKRTLDLPGSDLKIRMFVPENVEVQGTLLYLHGGGWTLFSLDTHDRLMREYARRTGCVVVGLDYSLAPEHRYPHALNDVLTCVTWLRENGDAYGLLTDRLVIGGDSAGGNLSIAAALKMRDTGQVPPAGLLLNYAALDTKTRPSYARYGGPDYMLAPEEMQDFWQDYLGPGESDAPYARVLNADLAQLPPTHLCIAECDILLDENLELSARLRDVGVPVSQQVYQGATHSFLEAVSVSSCAGRALDDAAIWLRNILTA